MRPILGWCVILDAAGDFCQDGHRSISRATLPGNPFADGNGRMARLLTVLLLYRHDYEVGRYVSLERLIEQTKDSYYDTLYRSSRGWHESAHDPMPWVAFSSAS